MVCIHSVSLRKDRRVTKPLILLSLSMDSRSQASAEYLLLIALGIVVLLVGIGVALQLRNLSSAVIERVRIERSNTLSMLAR